MLIAAVQTGPVASPDIERNVRDAFELVAASGTPPDLVVFPELFALPFWCVGLNDSRFLAWAEKPDGPTLQTAAAMCREMGCLAVVPFFERGDVAGEHFNSAAVIGADGNVIPGVLPSGGDAPVYRKNAVSGYNWGGARNDEQYYFRVGPGFPVFQTDIGVLGILICYDRWFPEAWRVLALQGAEVICVPNASSGRVADLFVPSIRTWSAQNVVFTVATNRAGSESIDGNVTDYYGLTCISSPRGEILAEAPRGLPNKIVTASVDLGDLTSARHDQTMYRDRRPELYGLITETR